MYILYKCRLNLQIKNRERKIAKDFSQNSSCSSKWNFYFTKEVCSGYPENVLHFWPEVWLWRSIWVHEFNFKNTTIFRSLQHSSIPPFAAIFSCNIIFISLVNMLSWFWSRTHKIFQNLNFGYRLLGLVDWNKP